MIYWNDENGFKGTPLHQEAQMSTIEDFEIDNDTIYYVGNYLDYTNELGQSTANSGGSFYIKNRKYMSLGDLPLPPALNARRITPLNKNRFLIISSDDKSYIIPSKSSTAN